MMTDEELAAIEARLDAVWHGEAEADVNALLAEVKRLRGLVASYEAIMRAEVVIRDANPGYFYD